MLVAPVKLRGSANRGWLSGYQGCSAIYPAVGVPAAPYENWRNEEDIYLIIFYILLSVDMA